MEINLEQPTIDELFTNSFKGNPSASELEFGEVGSFNGNNAIYWVLGGLAVAGTAYCYYQYIQNKIENAKAEMNKDIHQRYDEYLHPKL